MGNKWLKSTEGIGNRRGSLELKIPPDNIGNELIKEDKLTHDTDTAGNSILVDPTHLNSGVLCGVVNKKSSFGKNIVESYKSEFSQILKNKQGAAFSFTMNELDEDSLDEDKEKEIIRSVKIFLQEMLLSLNIDVKVNLFEYRSIKHWFVIFYIDLIHEDLEQKKLLIASLRKVLNHYLVKYIPQTNILVALKSAQEVIEGHLVKQGIPIR